MGLETVGVEFDTKIGVKVNDRLQTTNPSIYSAGDVCFPYQFTHAADAMAQIVIQNALFPHPLGLSRQRARRLRTREKPPPLQELMSLPSPWIWPTPTDSSRSASTPVIW